MVEHNCRSLGCFLRRSDSALQLLLPIGNGAPLLLLLVVLAEIPTGTTGAQAGARAALRRRTQVLGYWAGTKRNSALLPFVVDTNRRYQVLLGTTGPTLHTSALHLLHDYRRCNV
eukprot:368321-Rhodomonas_salina.1